MSMFDGNKYTCINCGRDHNQGVYNRSFDRPIKCKECKGWLCPPCHHSDEKAKEGKCPKCGGELYFPMFNI